MLAIITSGTAIAAIRRHIVTDKRMQYFFIVWYHINILRSIPFGSAKKEREKRGTNMIQEEPSVDKTLHYAEK